MVSGEPAAMVVHAPRLSRYSILATPDSESWAENITVTGFRGVPAPDAGEVTAAVVGTILSTFTATLPAEPPITTLPVNSRWSTVCRPLAEMVNGWAAACQAPPSRRYSAAVPAG